MPNTPVFQSIKEEKMYQRLLRYGRNPAVLAVVTLSAAFSFVSPPAQAAVTVDEPIQTSAGAAIFTVRGEPGSKVYFTVLYQGGECGSRAQVMAGQSLWGGSVRNGSLTLSETQRQSSYALSNLDKDIDYVLCLVDDASTTPPIAQSFHTTWMRDYLDPSWRQIGQTGAYLSQQQGASLAISPDGTPYIAYSDSANYGRATVKKFRNGVWENVGQAGFSGDSARTPTLAIAPDGTLYVAYTDQASPSNGRATVMKYDGFAWKTLGARGFSVGRADYLSLAIAPDGSPFFAYQDQNLNKNVVMKHDLVTGWQTVGMPGISQEAALYNSLIFSSDGTPYLAYRDGGLAGKATVMKYADGSWTPVGQPGFSGGIAFDVSLAFSPHGVLYAIYRDNDSRNNYAYYHKASVMRFDAQAQQWQRVGGAASPGSVSYPTLVFRPDGNPYVVYQGNVNDGYRVLSTEYSGFSWQPFAEGSISTVHRDGATYHVPQAAVAPDGTLYASYVENGELIVKRFADPESIAPSESWQELPALGPMRATRPDIAVGSDGMPIVMIGGGVLLTKFNGVSWQSVVPTPPISSAYSRYYLRLASDDTPFVLYAEGLQQGKLTMLTFDGSQWQQVGEPRFSSPTSDNAAFQLGPDDTPYVAYVDRNQGNRVTVMKYDGANWRTMGQPAFSVPATVGGQQYMYTPYLSLAISPDGVPYVAYRERTGSGEPGKTWVKRFNGSVWQDVGMPLYSYWDGSGLSLAFSPDGTLHLAFADTARGGYHGDLSVMRLIGQNWVSLGEPISGGEVSTVWLEFAADGTPYVLYKQVDEGHIVKLARYDGSHWILAGGSVVSEEDGYQMSMAIAEDGTVSVIYNTTGVSVSPMFKVKQLKKDN